MFQQWYVYHSLRMTVIEFIFLHQLLLTVKKDYVQQRCGDERAPSRKQKLLASTRHLSQSQHQEVQTNFICSHVFISVLTVLSFVLKKIQHGSIYSKKTHEFTG